MTVSDLKKPLINSLEIMVVKKTAAKNKFKQYWLVLFLYHLISSNISRNYSDHILPRGRFAIYTDETISKTTY